MTSATFGDLLHKADAHIEAALATARNETAHPAVAARELHRIFTTMARYLDDRVPLHAIEVIGRTDLSPWERAAVEARTAMQQAASSLGQITGPTDGLQEEPESGLTHNLAAAATCLAAGRDLLHTHLSTTPADRWQPRSPWARVVTSAPVTRALTGEVARWSRRLAPLTASLASHPSASQGEPGIIRDAYQMATHWLWTAGVTIDSGQAADPVTTDDRRLMRGIPAARGPTRRPPSGDESVTELCAGITDSAERLRAAVFVAAERGRWAPGATADTWRWTARAAAITGHASELILGSLAGHPGQFVDTPISGPELQAAANAVDHSCESWRHVAATWTELRTETHSKASPVVAEIGDLMLRIGRLAWDDPQWTPAIAHNPPPRPTTDLTSDGATATLAAIHQVTDALAHVATADQEAVTIADQAGRLYVRTRTLPQGYDVPRPYATAPTDRVQPVLHAYQAATQASTKAADMLSALAIAAGAPSSVLTLAHAAANSPASRQTVPSHNPVAVPEAASHDRRVWAGPVERAVRNLRVSDPLVLLRAATIDSAATALIAQAKQMSKQPAPQHTNHADKQPRQHHSAARLAAKDNPQPTPVSRANSRQASRTPTAPRRPGPARDPRPRRTSHQ